MAVSSVDGNTTVENTPEAEFDQALENAQADELTNDMVTQAIILGGQFIVMPRAQEILKEATADDEE
ncbi:hypothetical protein D16iCDA_09130 [Pseudomonas seleniipraecipitans]|jgi:hypothetical protein|uniref:Uncharacterized protein n=1 Tax=Phytopseudomonas seleniipraecipitans TaxID=640205 RepID=A0A1G7SJF0_9GAMM|nr:hypothetical protein [Pseudomonas seleniipraecipitans]NQD81443.1 hypothetical protein [Pseudomonas sp. CrR14]UUD65793.1 hypothetical protein D16iCDA_09130 [Pseudomonas seleniipraecipitans]SDG23004.1 hypothetical protein SAMN05216381_3472 [Pseudomonas seleniipraecipitans]